MPKTYILDTSVLIYDPQAYNHFPGSEVIIPIIVLNELDRLKKFPNDAGKNARVAIRNLDGISDKGDISIGILLDNNVMLKIDTTYIDTSIEPYLGLGDPTYGDTQILACAIMYNKHNDVTLVSNDINLKIKAKARGMDAVSHNEKGASVNDLYSGVQIICDEEAGAELQQVGGLDPRELDLELELNECVVFTNNEGVEVASGRRVTDNYIKLTRQLFPWNLSSRNIQQSLAIDMIMDPNIDLVSLVGFAGTGKSLITLAACLELVLNKRQYDKLIIYRPIQPVGSDIGYLPGSESEKLAPWFGATMDHFQTLFGSKIGNDWKRDFEMYVKKGKIELSALTYIRGKSINNAIIFLDECQNISKEEIKTILSRAGEKSKIIIAGDILQIDCKDLNAIDNGLTYTIEKFKGQGIYAHITLTKGERSRLATLAAEIL